jgi:hypothetical protein
MEAAQAWAHDVVTQILSIFVLSKQTYFLNTFVFKQQFCTNTLSKKPYFYMSIDS